MKKFLRPKIKCEICGLNQYNILHRHHIIPRQDSRCLDNDSNISILCPNCHHLVHRGEFTIIGVYSTSDGIQSLWFKKGEQPPLPKELWKVKDNPLVIIGGELSDSPEEGEDNGRSEK
jgi:hypothetical protein